MEIFARQGDLIINQTKERQDVTLRKARDLVLAGSYGSEHVVKGPVMYSRNDSITRLRVPEPTQLVHGNRHMPVDLPPGDYIVTSLRERGDAEDRRVED